MLRRVGFRQPRFLKRYQAVGQRCEPLRVSLDEHNMVALFGEHDGGREPHVPRADHGRVYLNGHEWAKRQLAKRGVGYAGLDNGFRSVADPDQLDELTAELGPDQIRAYFARWMRREGAARTPHGRRPSGRLRLCPLDAPGRGQ